MRKSDRLYVKWKGYNNLFDSWINKEDIVEISANIFLNSIHVVQIDISNYETKT